MANLSPQKQNISSLISISKPDWELRFDPTAVKVVRIGDQEEELSFCGTSNIPTSIGSHCVALYAADGRPSLVRDETENIVHRAADVGVLVGGGLLELLQPVPDEPSTLVPTGYLIDDRGPSV